MALAGSVLSRELRRKGPECWGLRRGLATSETCIVLTVRLAVLPALRHGGTNPRSEYCPVPDCDWRCACVGTSSAPLHNPTHAQAAPRRTLSLTIASQTIASSPDGSVSSFAASSACGTPAAAVGGGCRFRASSTVTSSSSPCNQRIRSFSRARALEPAGLGGKARSADGSKGAFFAVYCSRGRIPGLLYPESTPRVPLE
jgi:hypothetical protein